ncbi:MAG TPA: hypothetical protein ENK82_07760 [Campylobacterales bacterium]|nr:hypothetical protein [Campylobacterales bacterium]HHS93227.1 hypothetical protein [Campylobacterales bacterium]
MFKKVVISTLLSSALLLAKSGVGLNINEKDLEVEGVLDSRNLAALQTSSTIYQADVNFLNADQRKLLGFGIGATNQVEGFEGVEMTFGAKFIWAEVGNNEDFTSLPLMAQVRYTFPPLMYNIPPVALEMKGLYAPASISFGDSDAYSEFRVAADIEMIENVKVYTGYRHIRTKYKGLDESLFDNGFYGGIKITY